MYLGHFCREAKTDYTLYRGDVGTGPVAPGIRPRIRKRFEMKRSQTKRSKVRWAKGVCAGVDPHKWATKMEIRHLMSGKADLKIGRDKKQEG
jgi:hypothetical protein